MRSIEPGTQGQVQRSVIPWVPVRASRDRNDERYMRFAQSGDGWFSLNATGARFHNRAHARLLNAARETRLAALAAGVAQRGGADGVQLAPRPHAADP